jgi:hypothetical protein
MRLTLNKTVLLCVIMQKIINVLALTSFAVSAAVISSATYMYLNKDILLEDARQKITEAATEAITEALPGMLDGAMPSIPNVTGGAIPPAPSKGTGLPKATGPAIPMLP